MISNPTIRWSDNLSYGFAVGVIRTLEQFLFDRNQYEKLIRAKDVNEFQTLLMETRYGLATKLAPNSANISQIITAVHWENVSFCINYAADSWLKSLIQIPMDIFNLKTVLKNRYRKKNTSADELLPNGRWDETTINTIITGDPKKFSKDKEDLLLAHRLVNEAWRQAEQSHDPAIIDLLLDKLAQELVLMLSSGNDFAEGYYRLYADITNLKTLVRLKLLNEDEQTFQFAFLSGGRLSFSQLISVGKLGLDSIKELVGRTPLLPLLEIGLKALSNNESLLPMEKKGRELILDYINRARYVALGYEPLWRFFLLRENELTNLRQLYAAKIAGWGVKECQELVAYGY
ncbi:MAG: V-type ATPase subunit [bacterium]